MAQSLEFWFRRKYNLAPTDPRFLDATIADITAEFYAWKHFENPAAIEDVDHDFDMQAELARIEAEAIEMDQQSADAAELERLKTDPSGWEEI